MSAALKSTEVNPRPKGIATAPQPRRRLRVVHSPAPVSTPVVFPQAVLRDRPLWLKLLVAGQRLSLVMAIVTVGGALSAYALTVNNNRRLTAATATLAQLQDEQQQLTTANAVLKSNLAQTAINATVNGSLHPKDVIFLEADKASPAVSAVPVPEPEKRVPLDQQFFPKGY